MIISSVDNKGSCNHVACSKKLTHGIHPLMNHTTRSPAGGGTLHLVWQMRLLDRVQTIAAAFCAITFFCSRVAVTDGLTFHGSSTRSKPRTCCRTWDPFSEREDASMGIWLIASVIVGPFHAYNLNTKSSTLPAMLDNCHQGFHQASSLNTNGCKIANGLVRWDCCHGSQYFSITLPDSFPKYQWWKHFWSRYVSYLLGFMTQNSTEVQAEDETLRENNVYVKNLASDIDDEKLVDMFKVCFWCPALIYL
jgi:hypothetical protein